MTRRESAPTNTSLASVAESLRIIASRLEASTEESAPFSLRLTMQTISGSTATPEALATIDRFAGLLGIESGRSAMSRFPVVHYDAAGVIGTVLVAALDCASEDDIEAWHDAREADGEFWLHCPDKACPKCWPAKEARA